MAAEVELGYAVTTHRAQGATVDTAHTIVSASTSRGAAYVGLTRGRHANTAWVALDQPDPAHTHPRRAGTAAEDAALEVLTGVLARSGAEQSAHQVLRAEQDAAASIRSLAAEYDVIANHAQLDRWTALVRTLLAPDHAAAVVGSEAFGPLCHTLRRAEAHHHDPATVLTRALGVRALDDAVDPAAVLHARLERATQSTRPATSARLIAGLVPEALGPMDDDMRAALQQRQRLIEDRATVCAATAVQTGAAWVTDLDPRRHDAASAVAWEQRVRLVAAYRDLYEVTSSTPLGAPATASNQHRDAAIVSGILSTRTTRPTARNSTPTVAPGRGISR